MLINQGLIISLLLCACALGSVPKINVKLASSLKEVKLTGRDIENHIFITKRSKTYAGNNVLSFRCKKLMDQLTLKSPAMKLASLESKTGLIKWSKDSYVGKLNLILSKDSEGCDLVNEISLDRYISFLLTKEVRHDWPMEALKAQAIAARSYAYYKMKTKQVSKDKGHEAHYDLENSEKHQVNGSFFDEKRSTARAAVSTSGEVLTSDRGKIVPIFFHSKCGGHTLRPEQVWKNKIAGYESVKCDYCHKHGVKNWQVKLSANRLAELMDSTLRSHNRDKLKTRGDFLKIMPDQNENSFLRFYDAGDLKVLKKSRLRTQLGYRKAMSNNYKVVKAASGITLSGHGHGHGVGLCQFGAYEMAKRGYNHRQILAHYFPNFKVSKIY